MCHADGGSGLARKKRMKVIIRFGEENLGVAYDTAVDYEKAVEEYGEERVMVLDNPQDVTLGHLIKSARVLGTECLLIIHTGRSIDFFGYGLGSSDVVQDVDSIYRYDLDDDRWTKYGRFTGFGYTDRYSLATSTAEPILDADKTSCVQLDDIKAVEFEGRNVVVRNLTTFYKEFYSKGF